MLQIHHITWSDDAITKALANVSCSKWILKEIGVTLLNILMLSLNITVLSVYKVCIHLPDLFYIYFIKIMQMLHVDCQINLFCIYTNLWTWLITKFC